MSDPPEQPAPSVEPPSSEVDAYGIYRLFRRLVVALLGLSVLLVGVAMLVLPGPALLVIPVGLGILAVEFEWARRWLRVLKQRYSEIQDSFTGEPVAGPDVRAEAPTRAEESAQPNTPGSKSTPIGQ